MTASAFFILSLFLGSSIAFKLHGGSGNIVGIHGGVPIGIDQVPFMAHYRPRVDDTPVFCGASIINERFIVTAAHCTAIAEAMDYERLMYITVGTDKTIGGVDYEIENTFVHPDFFLDSDSISFDSDIAIIKLKDSIEFNDHIAPIKLAEPDLVFHEGDVFTAAGFGKMENGNASSTLLSVRLPFVDQETCKEMYANNGQNITDTMFCAGLIKKEGTCQGDSGGPVILDNALVGITSWGNGCASLKFPDVFSRVSALRPFIDDVLKNN